MPTNLLDQTIESTYEGVMHAEGASLPTIGLQTIYDGSGQASAIALGVAGNGAQISGGLSISGKLSSGELEFTNADSVVGEGFPLVTNGEGYVDFGQIVNEALPDMDPNPDGTYSEIDAIKVNSKGLVQQIFLSPIRQCWVNFDGKPITSVTYVANTSTSIVYCTKVNHGLATGQIINVVASNYLLNGLYPVTRTGSSDFTFPLPLNVTGGGTLSINTTVRSAYNVNGVSRTSAGVYRVAFKDSFNNNMYMTQVSKGSHSNPAANPATPATGDNGWSIVLSQASNYVDVFSQNGDCTNMNVFVVGNTLNSAVDVDEPLLFYTNFRYRDFYLSREINEQGSCSISSGTQTYTITPQYMAEKKLIAAEISIRSLDQCKQGQADMSAINSVTDIDGNTYNSSFTRKTNFGNRYGWITYGVTTFFVYINNQLFYKNFYTSGMTATTPFTAVDVKTTDVNIPPLINVSTNCGKNLAGSGTTTSYITDIITKYGFFEPTTNPAGFIRIQSANISTKITGSHNAECDGGFTAFKYIKEFFIP
jgi:hypothetical protein